ncbi:MAG: aminotransferase class I/II-fold pyridoxal phosphate-dependent enzyme [Firmicutes bacterium]|nr:aminotransferase class I/II-fold pyridoxal phosphate-dependent enzyme [Bacillota bacterium]
MPSLSQLVVGLKQSGIREIMNLAIGMPDVIRLEVGEPLFSTPAHIVEAAGRAAREGYTKYTANAGLLTLRELIARRFNQDYGLPVTAENVVVTVGGVGAVSGAVRAVVDPGDEVLIPDPGWPNYEMIVRCAGARVRRYPLLPENGFLPDPALIDRLIGQRTRALIINSPSNPLGTVFDEDLVRELVELAGRRDIFLIADEVYEKIVFEGRHHTALAFDRDGVVIGVFSASKTYAMTGWRLGYAIASQPVIAQMAKLQEAYVSCAPSVSQKAAEAALSGPQDCVEEMRRTYRENRDLAVATLDEYGIRYQRPAGAFYLWVDVGCEDSHAFARELLQTHRVAVAPGTTFGPSGREFVRVSLAAQAADIREGLVRLARVVKG